MIRNPNTTLVDIMRCNCTTIHGKRRTQINIITIGSLAALVLLTGTSAAVGIVTLETTQLVNTAAWECAPVWNTDGTMLFYATNESGNFDIQRIDADGTNKTRITNDSADEFPSFIWDDQIVYVSRAVGSDIRIMDMDGINKTDLTGGEYDIDPALVYVPRPQVSDMQPSGTIDNNMPAISAIFSCSYGNISTVNLSVDGTDVTPDADVTNSSVNYLPVEPLGCGDHDFIVEVKSDRYTVGYGRGNFKIAYITNPQPPHFIYDNRPTISANISVGYGSIVMVTIHVDSVNVTSDATITESQISYTPTEPLADGEHNATVSVKSTCGIIDSMTWVFYVNRCGGGGGGGSGTYPPGWFGPPQPKIAFTSNRSGDFDIWIMNTDGTGLIRLTDSPSNETHPTAVCSKVVYVSDKSGNYDLWSMDLDGSSKEQLTSSEADEYMPAESPFGGIVYARRSGSGDDYDLWVMNADGTGKTQLTNNPANEVSPVFSPSPYQLKVAYALESDDSDIWTTNFEETGDRVRIWRLEDGYVFVCRGIDLLSGNKAWLELGRYNTMVDHVVVATDESFSIPDPDDPIITGTLQNVSLLEGSAFEVELVNVTQYSTDGEVLFSNMTKILINAPIYLDTKRGDLNGDGQITSTDAVIALDLAVRGAWRSDADVSSDGCVTALDALMILQAAAREIVL